MTFDPEPDVDRDSNVKFAPLAQGIGLALTVDFEGLELHTTLKDCGIPYPRDVPDDIEILDLETPREPGPFGAAGVGEAPLTAPHPAILNACACGCSACLPCQR